MSKGLIVLAADVAQLQGLVQMPDGLAAEAIRSSWPGPVTWVMPADSAAPDWITGGQSTMAVRVTAHPLAAAICRAAGQALISTSANRAGRPPAKTAVQVRRLTQGVPVGIWPGQLGGLRGPTPIFDAATGRQLR